MYKLNKTYEKKAEKVECPAIVLYNVRKNHLTPKESKKKKKNTKSTTIKYI